jgi:hypothetical protein
LSLKQALTVTRGELEESTYESAQAAAAERSTAEGALLAGGLNLETQAQMQLLADQVAQLKLECTCSQQQLKTAKTTEVSLTTKEASLERYRKNFEDSLEAHRQRYEIMESTYQKK